MNTKDFGEKGQDNKNFKKTQNKISAEGSYEEENHKGHEHQGSPMGQSESFGKDNQRNQDENRSNQSSSREENGKQPDNPQQKSGGWKQRSEDDSSEFGQDVMKNIKDTTEQWTQNVGEYGRAACHMVEKNPIQSIVTSVIAGIILGILFKK